MRREVCADEWCRVVVGGQGGAGYGWVAGDWGGDGQDDAGAAGARVCFSYEKAEGAAEALVAELGGEPMFAGRCGSS